MSKANKADQTAPESNAAQEGNAPIVTDADVGDVTDPAPIAPPPQPSHAAPSLNDFIRQMERDVQERDGLVITRISHPDAEDGAVYQGVYAGIPLARGEPGMLLSDGRGFGSLEREDDPDQAAE